MFHFERAAWLVNTYICETLMPPSQRALALLPNVCMYASFAANLVAEVRGKRVPGAHPSSRNSASNICVASCLDFSKCGYTTIA